ncbi:unnamed protein product [Dovyalis caffra]|uniref:Cytochrome P450 n=1 Tax=Dovyalis caffra TaxID=77055 RepID=A0AAV1RYU9_9ROSI|nr:unnamed protein product [Dovyalis caffra]
MFEFRAGNLTFPDGPFQTPNRLFTVLGGPLRVMDLISRHPDIVLRFGLLVD